MIDVRRPTDHVAVIQVERSEKLNAMSFALLDQLEEALLAADADPRVRSIVLTGSGRAFSAGLDLTELERVGPAAGVEAGLDLQEAAVRRLLVPRRIATPVIAAINGLALGGGLSLALACDMRVCSPEATFVPGYQRLGLTGTDVGISWLLPRVVGASMAFDLMLTSRRLDAAEALACGLVSRVLEGDLIEQAVAVAEEVASLSPYAMRLTKQVMWANLAEPNLTAAVELENRNQVLALQTDDLREGLDAVRDGRRPTFG